MKDNIHTLILPDIHGRLFWKSAIDLFSKDEYPDLKIIFLGDYLDPYPSLENISKTDAIFNFEKIIEYAKNDDRIILLLGNHDFHYIYHNDDCRIDRKNFDYIRNLFINYKSLFKIAYEENINDITYLYTHAGITDGWYTHIKNLGNFMQANPRLSENDKLWAKEFMINFKPTSYYLNKFLNNSFRI